MKDQNINNLDTVFIAEHFNVLWKENWTREAEKVLKTFEKDVILKVKYYTGCFLMKEGKYELIAPFKMSHYKVKLYAKFH